MAKLAYRLCKLCGKSYKPHAYETYCPACSMVTLQCERCGHDFTWRRLGSTPKHCHACRAIVARQQNNEIKLDHAAGDCWTCNEYCAHYPVCRAVVHTLISLPCQADGVIQVTP